MRWRRDEEETEEDEVDQVRLVYFTKVERASREGDDRPKHGMEEGGPLSFC